MLVNQWLNGDFHLGDFVLQSGEELRDARIHYLQRGEIGAPGTDLVLLPTWYGGRCVGNLPLVEPGSPLADPRYTILIPGMLGAGESSSPDNAVASQSGAHWPRVSLFDQVIAQQQMLAALWPEYRLALVAGWSMGGMQSLQWGCLFPERVQRLAAWCAASRCYPVNRLFLDGLEACLVADPALKEGAHPQAGLRAFARVYASRAYGPGFWRDQCFRQLGFASDEALLRWWEEDHLAQNPFNLLAVLNTWREADISANPLFGHDHRAALAAIRAPALVMPVSTDSYFLAEEIAGESARMGDARLHTLDSEWGHSAGGPGRNLEVMEALFSALSDLMLERGAS